MLVLTRKTGERIHIGLDITVTVVQVHGNRVRIGIEAPQGVAIVRGELATLRRKPALDRLQPRPVS
jgi:carbon storage regulator